MRALARRAVAGRASPLPQPFDQSYPGLHGHLRLESIGLACVTNLLPAEGSRAANPLAPTQLPQGEHQGHRTVEKIGRGVVAPYVRTFHSDVTPGCGGAYYTWTTRHPFLP